MTQIKTSKTAERKCKEAEKAQRKALSNFAAKMLAKLELRNKRIIEVGVAEPWDDLFQRLQQGPLLGRKKDRPIWYYYKRMKAEVKELQTAIKNYEIRCTDKTRDAIISEACDCANFAAAIAEKAVEEIR